MFEMNHGNSKHYYKQKTPEVGKFGDKLRMNSKIFDVIFKNLGSLFRIAPLPIPKRLKYSPLFDRNSILRDGIVAIDVSQDNPVKSTKPNDISDVNSFKKLPVFPNTSSISASAWKMTGDSLYEALGVTPPPPPQPLSREELNNAIAHYIK